VEVIRQEISNLFVNLVTEKKGIALAVDRILIVQSRKAGNFIWRDSTKYG
jgi:hypothetical protein